LGRIPQNTHSTLTPPNYYNPQKVWRGSETPFSPPLARAIADMFSHLARLSPAGHTLRMKALVHSVFIWQSQAYENEAKGWPGVFVVGFS